MPAPRSNRVVGPGTVVMSPKVNTLPVSFLAIKGHRVRIKENGPIDRVRLRGECLRQGQQHGKSTPASLTAMDFHRAPVGFDYHSALVKPDARSALLGGLEGMEKAFVYELPGHPATLIGY